MVYDDDIPPKPQGTVPCSPTMTIGLAAAIRAYPTKSIYTNNNNSDNSKNNNAVTRVSTRNDCCTARKRYPNGKTVCCRRHTTRVASGIQKYIRQYNTLNTYTGWLF